MCRSFFCDALNFFVAVILCAYMPKFFFYYQTFLTVKVYTNVCVKKEKFLYVLKLNSEPTLF